MLSFGSFGALELAVQARKNAEREFGFAAGRGRPRVTSRSGGGQFIGTR
jgi:hypothetical protein